MDKTHKISDRFREVRKQLGLTQEQLASQLFLTRNYIAKIESDAQEPSARVVRDLESLRVAFENKVSTMYEVQETRGPYVEKRNQSSGKTPSVTSSIPRMIDPRHAAPGQPSGRRECEAYFAQVMAAAAADGDPDLYPSIMRRLKKYFPLDEFGPDQTET